MGCGTSSAQRSLVHNSSQSTKTQKPLTENNRYDKGKISESLDIPTSPNVETNSINRDLIGEIKQLELPNTFSKVRARAISDPPPSQGIKKLNESSDQSQEFDDNINKNTNSMPQTPSKIMSQEQASKVAHLPVINQVKFSLDSSFDEVDRIVEGKKHDLRYKRKKHRTSKDDAILSRHSKKESPRIEGEIKFSENAQKMSIRVPIDSMTLRLQEVEHKRKLIQAISSVELVSLNLTTRDLKNVNLSIPPEEKKTKEESSAIISQKLVEVLSPPPSPTSGSPPTAIDIQWAFRSSKLKAHTELKLEQEIDELMNEMDELLEVS